MYVRVEKQRMCDKDLMHSLEVALPVDALRPDFDRALLKDAGRCDILV